MTFSGCIHTCVSAADRQLAGRILQYGEALHVENIVELEAHIADFVQDKDIKAGVERRSLVLHRRGRTYITFSRNLD